MLVAAGLGLPVPEEIPTIGAGIWVGSHPDFGPLRWLILPVCFLGVLISDVMLYGIGRWWGPHLRERPWAKRLLPPTTWERIEGNFNRYGIKILLMVRWVPAIRSPMFITAGIMRLPLARFILADAIAACFGHTLLFALAYWFGDQFGELVERWEKRVDHYKPLIVLLLLGAVAAYLTYHFWRRPVSTGDLEEIPLIGDKVAAKIAQSTMIAPAGVDGTATPIEAKDSAADRGSSAP